MGYIGNDGSALAGGLNPSGAVQGIGVDGNGRLITSGYIGSSSVGLTNPYPTLDQVDGMIANGQGYVAIGKLTSVASSNAGLAIFNPASSGKTVLIYRATQTLTAGNALTELRYNSADFALGAAVTPANLKAGGAAGVATVSSAASAATGGVGTLVGGMQSIANTSLELLQSNTRILLPNGAQANGFELLCNTSAAGTLYLAIYWVEY